MLRRTLHTVFCGVAVGLLCVPLRAQAADPTTADCLSANNSSVELRNAHRLREARAQLLVCAAASCPLDIQKECLRRVDEVNAQIPTIIFQVKDTSGRDLSAVKVTMDGQPFADRLEGTALSADPGEHTFTFETEGQAAITRHFIIQEAQKERRETITFGAPLLPPAPAQSTAAGATPAAGPAPATVPPPALGPPAASGPPPGVGVPPPVAAPPAGGPGPSPVAPSSDSNSGLGTQKIIAIAAAGVGVVGLGVGTAFGLMAASKKNDARDVCPAAVCPTPAGVNMWNDAKNTGNLSTVFFVVGGVGIAAGAVLWLTAKPASGPGPQLGLGPGSIQLRGTW